MTDNPCITLIVQVIAPGNVPSQIEPRELCLFLLRYFEDLEIFNSKYSVVVCDHEMMVRIECWSAVCEGWPQGSLDFTREILLELLPVLPAKARNNLQTVRWMRIAMGCHDCLLQCFVLHPGHRTALAISVAKELYGTQNN